MLRCYGLVCAGVLLAVISTGCGGSGDRPRLGRVAGAITLDGQPVSMAYVIFKPVGGGRSSTAMTDENGAYNIRYDEEFGASVGEHVVSITTYRGPNGSDPGRAELIPKRYNSQSELRVTVERGKQTHDFALQDVPGERKPQPPKLRSRELGD